LGVAAAGWLLPELLFHDWIRDAIVAAVSRLVVGTQPATYAALDWMSDQWDLWRFLPLLDGWRRSPPPFFQAPARSRPAGWRRPIRPAAWSNVKTLGDIALQLLTKARAQANTPPVLDLAPRCPER
jgi:hypothetical protein